MIKVTYKNTINQWVECANYNNKSRDVSKKINMPRLAITIIAIIAAIVAFIYGALPSAIIFVAFAFIYYFLYPTLVSKATKKLLKKMAVSKDMIPKEEIEVKLDGEEVFVNLETGSRSLNISEIEDATIINDCFFIRFKDDISLIIPLDAFDNEEDKENFIDRISKRA